MKKYESCFKSVKKLRQNDLYSIAETNSEIAVVFTKACYSFSTPKVVTVFLYLIFIRPNTVIQNLQKLYLVFTKAVENLQLKSITEIRK